MLFYSLNYLLITIIIINALEYPINTNSEMAEDINNKGLDLLGQDSSSHELEVEKSNEQYKDKRFLEDAMKIVLDPVSNIDKRVEISKNLTVLMAELDNDNVTLKDFMKEMDRLSAEICMELQEALWSHVTDVSHEIKEMIWIKIASEVNIIKKLYWRILKERYHNDPSLNDPIIKRKYLLVKERAISVYVPVNKRNDISDMQKMREYASVCVYNKKCVPVHINDIISTFQTSNDTEELKYYWKSYRDATGKKYKFIFKAYVNEMNIMAKTENFTDAGEVWRSLFEDDDFSNIVQRLWEEIKPLYNDLHQYVKIKLTSQYKNILDGNSKHIPAHILGTLWAEDWQQIYRYVAPYPNLKRPMLDKEEIEAKDLFKAVDLFYISLGYNSANDSYADINESTQNIDCISSSHDLCDGINYRIKWCGEKYTDIAAGLLKTGRLLGRIQYFKSYSNLPPFYRNEPIPGFLEALSDIVAMQVISPEYIKGLNWSDVEISREASINHLLWLSLEKIPRIGYAYTLDKWRWDVFSDKVSAEHWNQHWWDLREKETLISAPVPRNKSDLDPASAYHVVSHKQYIEFFIAYIIEFQVLLAMCKKANYEGPLHECNVYGNEDAGRILRRGMSEGSWRDWRMLLELMTGDKEISTAGILEYFAPLRQFLQEENSKFEAVDGIDGSAPIVFGFVTFLLLSAILVLVCRKKKTLFSFCGLSKNGSLDIVTNDLPKNKSTEGIEIAEEKL